jgi:DNA-binding Xre family transcriptional regulator
MEINVNQIYIWMARRNMNQSDIARKSGLTKQAVSTIFSRKTCSPRNLGKIANALNVDPGEIAKV